MVKIFAESAKKNQIATRLNNLSIESIDHQGRGVAHYNGKVVFVQGALPSENVSAKVISNKASFVEAEVIKVLNVSPHRIVPECQWFGGCGGCQLQHAELSAQVEYKQQFIDGLFAKHKIVQLPWASPLYSNSFRYRNQFRLATWFESKQAKLHVGFRQKNSKNLVEISDCIVCENGFWLHFDAFKTLLNNLSCKKFIGHIEVSYLSKPNIIVGLRLLCALSEQDKQQLIQFGAVTGFKIAILETDKEIYWIGESKNELIKEHLGLKLSFELSDFHQINTDINIKMVEQVIEWLDLNETDCLLDLYCGIGNFSLPMAQKVQTVVGVEGVKEMVERATFNANLNSILNTRFLHQDLSDSVGIKNFDFAPYNKIILDPSREGAFELCKQAGKWQAQHVLYIACDPNSLVRDSQQLMQNGYTLKRIGVIDMFAQTAHIETMALFSKIDG